MINSNKLIPRRSSGNSLNLTATSDLNVVRGTVVKIDNILKERLVLSKVREGIIRQQEERRIRSRRETLLERDDVKNNYSVDDEDKIKKPKSGLGGLLGSVFKGILGSLGSVAFGLTPSLLGVGLLVRKLTNPFLAITGVAFATLNVVVSKSGSQFKEIERKVNKSDISESRILGGAQSVVDALIQAAFILGGGTLAGRGVRRAIGGKRFTKQGALLQLEKDAEAGVNVRRGFKTRRDAVLRGDLLPVKGKKRKKLSAKQQALRDFELDPELAFEDALRYSERVKGKSILDFKRFTPEENFLRITNPFGFEEITKPQKKRGKKRVKEMVVARAGEEEATERLIARLAQKRLADTAKIRIDRTLGRNRGIAIDFSDFEDVPIDEEEFLKLDAEMRKAKPFGKPTGFDMFGNPQYRVNPRGRSSVIDDDGVMRFRARKARPPRFKTSPAMRRGMTGQQLGFSRILDRGMLRVGGRKLAKSTFGKGAKSIIRSSVSGIPLIGDLIALLLDVFVFGEPVGRAAFMAVGSIIGGIIGGVAGLVAGPVGALIGGLVGSVGGDLLGAAFYDLIFRRGNVDVGSRFGNAITRGGIKAGVSGALEAGGFANYGKYLLGEAGTEFVLDADSTAAIEDKYPGFLMALNKSDGAGAIDLIREYASYETEGRVDFIPIPIPSVTNSDPQVIVINSQPKDKRLYSQHYRRG